MRKTYDVDLAYPSRVGFVHSACESFLKLVAALRLVLATALFAFFSATAFAHDGHHDGGQTQHAAIHATLAVPHFDAGSSTPFVGTLAASKVVVQHEAVIVTAASSDWPAMSDRSNGCCCSSNGASACGMSGCSALGLSTADGYMPRPLRSNRLMFKNSDVVAGRADSGLDRPPKD